MPEEKRADDARRDYEERIREAQLIVEHAPDEECRTVWQHIVRGYEMILQRLRN
jgi:hypothetical protein